MPAVTFVENLSNRSSGVQTVGYLYSFWVLFVLYCMHLNNNMSYELVILPFDIAIAILFFSWGGVRISHRIKFLGGRAKEALINTILSGEK